MEQGESAATAAELGATVTTMESAKTLPADNPLGLETVRDEAVSTVTDAHIRMLIDVDLQTFSEPTFSHYTAAAFLQTGRVFALFLDEDVIGTGVFMRRWDHPNEANLLSMGVLPGFRGQGLGQTFLMGMLEQLRRSSVLAVTLMVAEDNRRARKVYLDAGFVETGVAYKDPRTSEGYVQLRVQLLEPLVTALPSL